jgi:hypothetical protein
LDASHYTEAITNDEALVAIRTITTLRLEQRAMSQVRHRLKHLATKKQRAAVRHFAVHLLALLWLLLSHQIISRPGFPRHGWLTLPMHVIAGPQLIIQLQQTINSFVLGSGFNASTYYYMAAHLAFALAASYIYYIGHRDPAAYFYIGLCSCLVLTTRAAIAAFYRHLVLPL